MVKMPDFMKLVECECGWTLYSMYGRPVECPKCYKIVKSDIDEAREFLIERDHERKV